MNRKILAALLVLCLTLGNAFALSSCSDDPKYEHNGTAGLRLQRGDDKEHYIVTGIGEATAADIVIPTECDGKPVTLIWYAAFRDCTSIKSVTIPSTVKVMEDHAFGSCTALERVRIEPGVTVLPKWVFYNCTSLAEVNIPSSVVTIEEHALSHCSALTSITVPEGVSSIGFASFSACTSLKELALPKSLESLDAHAIDRCTALTDIYYGGTMAEWNALTKHDQWDTETKAVVIHCLDGNIVKQAYQEPSN